MTDISLIINNALLEEQEKNKKRDRSGKWSPSKMGRCLRFQYWSRANEVETDLPDVTALRRFAVGHLFHDYIQAFFIADNCEVLVETNDVKGYADIVEQNEVVDIKSVNDWAYKFLLAKEFDVNKEKPEQCMQVALYCKLLNKSRGSLLYVNTKSLATIQCEVDLAKFIPLVDIELSTLNSAWEKKALPPAVSRCYNGKECSYCNFLTACNKLEGKT
jgi:hypothetical protein